MTDVPTAVSNGARGKERRLESMLGGLASVVVAFSGGVDSAYLAILATRILGVRALAVTGDSPSYPDNHRQLARRVASEFSVAHEFVRTDELARAGYRANAGDRCFHCKTELYTTLSALARTRGYAVVIDGSNADDRGDYRPGRQAARDYGVRSPLDEVDLGKDEIRELSRALGMSSWDEPASACLSSRIPHHVEVTAPKLQQIERAEAAVRALGFRVFRVRHHDQIARLELAREEMERVLDPELAERLVIAVKAAGYRHVSLDLQGYRQGSLNDGLVLRPVS